MLIILQLRGVSCNNLLMHFDLYGSLLELLCGIVVWEPIMLHSDSYYLFLSPCPTQRPGEGRYIRRLYKVINKIKGQWLFIIEDLYVAKDVILWTGHFEMVVLDMVTSLVVLFVNNVISLNLAHPSLRDRLQFTILIWLSILHIM